MTAVLPKKFHGAAGKSVMRKETNYRRTAFAVSAALHLLAFFLIGFSYSFWPTLRENLDERKEPRPPLVFTLAETPESARRESPPEEAAHVSDKNAVAQNPETQENLPVGKPFTSGLLADAAPSTNLKETGTAQANKVAEEAASVEKTERRSTEGFASNFSREFLTGGQFNPSRQSQQNLEADLENRQSRAPELGSFSLSTYNWDFAPYLLWLKNHIQRNIYPPPAFTHMGMISGRTQLRFRISRDGILHGIELLGYDGHKSLMETSVRAVQLSAPFRALPHDFPEDYLEVTAQFDYIIIR
jgi:hypothetical protein